MNEKLSFKKILLRFKGLFSIGLTDVISGAISILFWLYVATLIDIESYGNIFYLLAIASVVSTVSLIGSSYTLTVYVSKNIKLESALFLIVIIFGSISTLIMFLIYQDLGSSLYVIGSVIFAIATAEILAKKHYTTYSKYLIIQKISLVILSLGLYNWVGTNGIILGISFSFFIYLPIIIKTFKTTTVDFSLLRPRFGFLINSYMMNITLTLTKQIDKIIILPLLGSALLGNYQLALQFIGIFQLLPLIVLKYTIPHDVTGNPNKHLKIIVVLSSTCFTVLVLLLAPIIIPIFFAKFLYVVGIIQILSLSLISSSISTIYASKFLGNGDSKTVLIQAIIYFLTFILGIFIIGTTLGIQGIAIAYVVSSIISVIFVVIIDLRNKISQSTDYNNPK